MFIYLFHSLTLCIFMYFRLRRVEGRASRDVSLLHTEPESEAPPAKRLRGSDTFVAGTTSSAILPAVCIFCKRECKDIQNKSSKKWTREKLSKSEHINNPVLLNAAELKKDESLLRHIRGRDLVAGELRYHHSCYMDYTNFLTWITQTF